MTESIIQPEPFPRDFCMFDNIVLYINYLMSLFLIAACAFKFKLKVLYIVLSLLCIFLNSKTTF